MPIISYDRLIKGAAPINYYSSFDNEQVGRLQGLRLLQALVGTPHPTGVPAGLLNNQVNNGMANVLAILLTPGAVTKANLKDTVV